MFLLVGYVPMDIFYSTYNLQHLNTMAAYLFQEEWCLARERKIGCQAFVAPKSASQSHPVNGVGMITHKPLPVQPMNTCRDGIPDGGGVFFLGDPPVDHWVADGLAAGW